MKTRDELKAAILEQTPVFEADWLNEEDEDADVWCCLWCKAVSEVSAEDIKHTSKCIWQELKDEPL